MGIAEFLRVCLPMTTGSPRPLARAVSTYSSFKVSSTEERVMRAMRAA